MAKGFLTVELFVGEHVLPVKNTRVLIKDKNGIIIYELMSNENGLTEKVSLDAPDKKLMLDPNNTLPIFSIYDVEVPMTEAYKKAFVHNIQIFDGIASILPIQMHPALKDDSPENSDDIYIPPEHGIDLERELAVNPVFNGFSSHDVRITEKISANEVSIPEYITVHLGSPNASTRNVRVTFKDYIKNVASSEIYPIWEESAIYANIYAQISFALNRVYTVWYRSRDKDFDITNNTAFDQYFVEGRNIFENISRIVDSVFNIFIRRQGRKEPYFTSYCNGTTSQCDGMSQWGTQSLALRGYSPIEILKHYYPSDIQICESVNFTSSYVGAYGGVPLKEGLVGEDVRTMQLYLNRISGNFYIPSIPNPNGSFCTYTKAAAIEFQKLNYLIPDGIIGPSTWYAITKIYVAVKELAELTSEGERICAGEKPPTVTVQSNSRGEHVVELQFLLNYISEFYPSISFVIQNGVFRDDTKKTVIEFQKEFGLTADGIVGAGTWRKLYEVYHAIASIIVTPPNGINPSMRQYPGSPLRVSSRGEDVLFIQNYLIAIAKVYTTIPAIVADGVYGSDTAASVAAFQRQFGLSIDGVIGQSTWYKIIDIYNSIKAVETPIFPGASIRMGFRGNDVLLMQEYLKKISVIFPDIPSLNADGVYGSGTQATVIAFQSLFGLTPDGVIGKNTWDKIVYVYNSMPSVKPPQYPGAALRTGSHGNDVVIMQKYLNKISEQYKSITAITADGSFGAKTQTSVIAFQRQFGLTADGVIGKNTWNKIVSVYNTIILNTVVVSAYYNKSANAGNYDMNKYALLLAFSMYGMI